MNTQKIKEIQANLSIPQTGILDDFTQAAWKNYCLKENITYTPIVDDSGDEIDPVTYDVSQGFISTDLSVHVNNRSLAVQQW